jgi:two-component system, chemotaxis family, sensor kinase CheA
VDMVGELVVAHAMVAGDPALRPHRHEALGRNLAQSGKILRQLQELATTLRLVPLRPLYQRVERLVRELSRESGKQVQLEVHGEDTEIDRGMVDLLADPLVHMIRNAIDHGLEPAAARLAAGKPPAGLLRLSAWHAGGDVVVELHDDGRGLDLAGIHQRAVARGLVDADRQLSRDEVAALIFANGLSTAESVTSLSGRGVGMDVVRRNLDALRGRMEIATEPGRGTTFRIRLPLTLALTEGMLVEVGGERYIVPTADIRTCCRPPATSYTEVAGAGELVTWHGATIPVIRLHALFGTAGAVTDPAQGVLVVVGEGARRHALLVDALLGQHQFVVKPVGAGLGPVRGVAGTAVLADGRVGLILDVASLAGLTAS